MKNGIFYQKRPNPEEVQNSNHEDHFRKIVSRAWSRWMDTGETAPQILHHHSRQMVMPLDNYNPSIISHKVRTLVCNLEQRLELSNLNFM